MICPYCGSEAKKKLAKKLEYINDGELVNICPCKEGMVYAVEGYIMRDREYRKRWEDLRGKVIYYSAAFGVQARELWRPLYEISGYNVDIVSVDTIDGIETLETMHVILDKHIEKYRR